MDWVVIEGVKYDITEFASKHPGGKEIILTHHGMDATDVFLEFHKSTWATNVLKSLPVISNVRQQVDSSPLDQEIRTLRTELEREGRWIPSRLFYARKILELFGLFGISGLLLMYQYTFWSTVWMGLFFQQSGWLAHDFAHNQVTRNLGNRAWFLHVIGNLFQGFSGGWWTQKHSLHHARTNAFDEVTKKPVEEDFDSAPIVYFTELLRTPGTPWSFLERTWTRYQGFLLWLVLPFSKFVWDMYSIQHAWAKDRKELAWILAHYAWILVWSVWFSGKRFLLFLIGSRLWGGFFLGWVFVQSHNGMEYYERPDVSHYSSQIISTRNMSLDPFSTWFTGGLNYQIEHHMFPRMPRHHLPFVAERVKNACTKHGFKYEVLGILQGTVQLTRYLHRVGKRITSEASRASPPTVPRVLPGSPE